MALIAALLWLALATTAAVGMAVRQQLDIRRASNVFEFDQALLYVQGVEDWSLQLLKRDAKDGNTDSLDEDWAMELPPIPVEGGQLAGRMEDMQGRFNINSLVDSAGKLDALQFERFGRLLQALELPAELAYPIADWLDADDDVSMGGAEQVEYLGFQPPYRAHNGPMASVSELRLVQGMTPEFYAKLESYVAALPRGAALNVSTLSEKKPELLMCIAPGITKEEAEMVLSNRGAAGFTSVQDLKSEQVLQGRNIADQGLTVSSSYFMVTSHVQVGRSVFTTYSLLDRSPSGARTLMRAQGTY